MKLEDLIKLASIIDPEPISVTELIAKPSVNGLSDFVGRYSLVRTYSAGVWSGVVSKKDGNEIILSEARRLWSFAAREGISISALATGPLDSLRCRFTEPVDGVWLEAIEIIPVSNIIEAGLRGEKNAKQI